jgi:hypothetical protein
MSSISSKAPFDFRKSVAYAADAKRQFHREAQRRLRQLATALGFARGDYDLRSNQGGIAVSGEVTMHAEHLYVQASQPAFAGNTGILFRTCRDRQDYVGGCNHFASLDELHDPERLANIIRGNCDF